jgi:4-amino-4-deoxy-L-arabinose transferase-like glycosyltransferase
VAEVTANVPADAHAHDAGDAARKYRTANKVLIGAALALCAVRLAMAAYTGLVDDEAYYRIWSLAPALSYYDHPPMVAWMIGAGRAIAGDTTLGVRLLAPFCHLFGAALLWRTTKLLYGAETARRTVWIMLAMPLLAVGGIIITPDLPSVLFAGLVLWALAELDRSQNANWWLAIGLFAGLGLISKYTNLFLGATIMIWLVAVSSNHKWLRAPQLWIGGLMALAVTSPVVIWNAEHDWVSFAKQFGRVAHNGSAGPGYLLELAGAFIALASPVIAVLAIAGLIHVARSAYASRKSSDVLVAATVLPMLLYFVLHALHDRVQGNWLAPIYPALALCAAIGLDTLVPAHRRQAVFATAVGLGFAITGLIYVHALNPFRTVLALKDPTEQMHGWPALADAVDKRRREVGAAWVATSSYASTGQFAMGLKGRSEVAQITDRVRYTFLPPLPPELLKQPVLYIELKRRIDRDLPMVKEKYRNITALGSLTRDNGTATGAVYELYLLSDPPQPPF